jgi:hypothetical protein
MFPRLLENTVNAAGEELVKRWHPSQQVEHLSQDGMAALVAEAGQ